MKNKLMVILLAALSLNVQATVIDFEDLTSLSPVYDGYAGFNWLGGGQGIYAIDKNYALGSGYDLGTVSGTKTVLNWFAESGNIISLASPGTFDFNGAYWTSAWSNQSIWFAGFKNGNLIYSSNQFAINTQNPLWIGLNWNGIDQLHIFNNGSHWAMDNFTFNKDNNSIDAPGALALMGFGLAGMILRRRRQK